MSPEKSDGGDYMKTRYFEAVFNNDQMKRIFPESVADRFFDALFGDPDEGAYDIGLVFDKELEDRLLFQFRLTKRPGKCLRCNLTYGLPEVFSRHPAINIQHVVGAIDGLLDGKAVERWEIGKTREIDESLHLIPLTVFLKPPGTQVELIFSK
jgi:hypothetical protein